MFDGLNFAVTDEPFFDSENCNNGAILLDRVEDHGASCGVLPHSHVSANAAGTRTATPVDD